MIEWIWPSCCAACGQSHRGRLCDDCLPIAPHRAPVPNETMLRGVYCLTGYNAPLAQAVRRAKYQHDLGLMRTLGDAFAERMAPALSGSKLDAIVPVPSPWTRVLQRGFSPAMVLGHRLSLRTGIPVVNALRIKPGQRQATLNRSGRRKNLVGRVRSRCGVPGSVLLIDDVLTTGATASAATQELLGYDTQAVWLAALCAHRPDRDTP